MSGGFESDVKKELDILGVETKSKGREVEPPTLDQLDVEQLANDPVHAAAGGAEVTIEAKAIAEAFAHLGEDQLMIKKSDQRLDPDKQEFDEGVAQDFVPDSAVAAGAIIGPPAEAGDYFAPFDRSEPKIDDDEGEPPPSGSGDDDDDEDKKPKKKPKPPKLKPADYGGFYNPD